jgi:hypothetical protein
MTYTNLRETHAPPGLERVTLRLEYTMPPVDVLDDQGRELR